MRRRFFFEKMKIQDLLLAWYDEHKRSLPWRENTDAYRVWVSEIMLQQTRVEAVKPYFYRFMETLPTMQSLANVEEDTLHKLWEGLGYYNRVRNMQKAAQICCELYNGQLPNNYDTLLTLPGIGPYTAGAIASIAYHEQVCAIDGNVLRVYARLLDFHADILVKKNQLYIQQSIEQDMCQRMGDFNQALMDLGSAICVPSGVVRCNICPLQKVCLAYERGTVNHLPIRIKKTTRKKHQLSVCIYVWEDQVLIHKRPKEGLLANLYEFVNEDGHKTKKDLPASIYLGKYKHLFSHVEWDMKGFIIPCEIPFEKKDYQWVPITSLQTMYSIPGAYAPYRDLLYEKYLK